MKKITLFLAFMALGYTSIAQQAFGFLVEENWINTCDAGTLTMEDFTGGPTDLTACGPEISSVGDNCYPENELQEGFSITIENDADVTYYPAGLAIQKQKVLYVYLIPMIHYLKPLI